MQNVRGMNILEPSQYLVEEVTNVIVTQFLKGKYVVSTEFVEWVPRWIKRDLDPLDDGSVYRSINGVDTVDQSETVGWI